MTIGVAALPLNLLSSMYWRRPISARATSFTRTMALPSGLARRMMSSYRDGSTNGAWVTTGKVICTLPAFGSAFTWPAPNSAFWFETAFWMSVVVMPSEAMRSGFIQMRIAWSGTPKICAWPAPLTRLIASRT